MRGDFVIAQTARGLEWATILCPTSQRHTQQLDNTPIGTLRRIATSEDHQRAATIEQLEQELFTLAQRRIHEMNLPMELLDVELLFDGEHSILHHLNLDKCDPRPLVSELSKSFDVHVTLFDLTAPQGGCGSCGSSEGGCGSGGCGSGNCGAGSSEELQAYFAELRERMHNSERTTLL